MVQSGPVEPLYDSSRGTCVRSRRVGYVLMKVEIEDRRVVDYWLADIRYTYSISGASDYNISLRSMHHILIQSHRFSFYVPIQYKLGRNAIQWTRFASITFNESIPDQLLQSFLHCIAYRASLTSSKP